MEDKIKEILSVFLKVPADQIHPATAIDRTAISSSIVLHRMYAKLSGENIVVKDYQEIKNFGDLLAQVNGNNAASLQVPVQWSSMDKAMLVADSGSSRAEGIGIDLEHINAMPVAEDFREDPFYTMNFAASEIAYCILQQNPYASFGGLFAAKEAIVKADNSYKNRPFNSIQIMHQPGGKPFYSGFNISISHTGEMIVVVAIAAQTAGNAAMSSAIGQPAEKISTGTSAAVWVLVFTSLVLSLVSLFLILYK